MGEFDNDYTFDGDDFSGGNWSEKDWKEYLGKVDLQISLFLHLFVSSRNIINHLDLIAIQMGWCKSQSSVFPQDLFEKKEEPFTIHSHPVAVVTRGLYHFLSKNWEIYMKENPDVDAKLCWLYSNLLHHGERNAILAIACMDEGDDFLSVCHFKNALQVLNFTLETIPKIPKNSTKSKVLFQDALIACFDLREVWIKVMETCKNNDNEDEEDE